MVAHTPTPGPSLAWEVCGLVFMSTCPAGCPIRGVPPVVARWFYLPLLSPEQLRPKNTPVTTRLRSHGALLSVDDLWL